MKKAMLFMLCLSISTLLTAIGVAVIAGCSDMTAKLHVYSWSDYFDPELIEQFEKENNCKVIIDSFDSNEAMFAKLKAGATGYDVMTPSTYQIQALIDENLISPIDHDLISNVVMNFDHKLDGQILDPTFEWSVPYACTYTGLMCYHDAVGEVKSWDVLGNAKFKGKISLLDDIRETIGIGLMYNGYSLNSTNESEIMAAAKQIIKWRSNIRKFDSESYKTEVADKSSWIGHGYSADAAQVIIADARTDIEFVLPDEGFTIAWDEFVVSSGSRQKELAHKFIDFFYADDVALQNMQYVCSLTANKNAFSKLPDEYKALFVPKNLSKGQLLKGFKDKNVLRIYNKAWDMIKTVEK